MIEVKSTLEPPHIHSDPFSLFSHSSSLPSQPGVEGVAQSVGLVSQAKQSFERNADVNENRGDQADGPILGGLAARRHPVLRM
jgi:hypothetical protein